ncbi:hypothetical protein AVEN_171843-1 [Araneus ventricosus]|uniref:Uncharacterized protein n=1 Tax=Araneus ventricosus TaxID=182803 RepID=A0A4Y2F8C9_ARAVE|nr:hypothetical protein AVEN_171843-1 [Araneus ventricosus]
MMKWRRLYLNRDSISKNVMHHRVDDIHSQIKSTYRDSTYLVFIESAINGERNDIQAQAIETSTISSQKLDCHHSTEALRENERQAK